MPTWKAYAKKDDITATKLDDLAAPDDNTDLNATAAAHGLLPKLSNVVTEFLNGTGVFSVPVGAALPSGCIVIWTGTIANIPSGYVICDGNNSTPNLLAKFVEGVATAATNPGTTGGAISKTTAGHTHGISAAANLLDALTKNRTIADATDSISDIRPPYYDVAFIMKT